MQAEPLPPQDQPNKYKPQERIGRPTLGTAIKVRAVGLGNLTTETTYGRTHD